MSKKEPNGFASAIHTTNTRL